MATRQTLPLVLVAVLVVTAWADEGCSEGEGDWSKQVDAGCIIGFQAKRLRLLEAKEKCKHAGGVLPRPASEQQQNALYPEGEGRHNSNYWLAPMTSNGGQATWEHGKSLTWANWDPEMPVLSVETTHEHMKLTCASESKEPQWYAFEFYKRKADGSYDRYNPLTILPGGAEKQEEIPKGVNEVTISPTDVDGKYADGYFVCISRKTSPTYWMMKKSLAVGVKSGMNVEVPVCAFAAKTKKYWTLVDPVDCGENAQWPWARAYCVKPKADEMMDFNRLHVTSPWSHGNDNLDDFNGFHGLDDLGDLDDFDDDDDDFKVKKEKRAELVDLLKKALRIL